MGGEVVNVQTQTRTANVEGRWFRYPAWNSLLTFRRLLTSPSGYLNRDVPEHRDRLLRGAMPPTTLWVLDEIHKYRAWRGMLKGLYDNRRAGQKILVTGSARLDFNRYGGDSLQGRLKSLPHPLGGRVYHNVSLTKGHIRPIQDHVPAPGSP